MPFIADRVKETTTTTGTGTVNLAGAATGYRTFVAAIGTGNTCCYCIELGSEWEVGIGTVTDASPDTLSRTTIIASSNSNAAVSFSAGTKNVFVVNPARYQSAHVRTITGAHTCTDQDRTIRVNTSSAITVGLPTAVGRAGKRYTIVKASNDSGITTIDANGTETIDGIPNFVLVGVNAAIEVESDGANWSVVCNKPSRQRVTTTDATAHHLVNVALADGDAWEIDVRARGTVTAIVGGGASPSFVGDITSHYECYHFRRQDAASGSEAYDVFKHEFGGLSELAELAMDVDSNLARAYLVGATDTTVQWDVEMRIIKLIN